MIADATDILLGREGGEREAPKSIQDIINPTERKRKKAKADGGAKRPEGMHRELYNLLVKDKSGAVPGEGVAEDGGAAPLFPSLTPARLGGYRNPKARLGLRKTRTWLHAPFVNPARADGLQLHHWRRQDQSQDYPFARFNKQVELPSFTDQEYQQHLSSQHWSLEETRHLMDLAERFDLRWFIIHDRWEKERFRQRSVEDLKERFYGLWNQLIKARTPEGVQPELFKFDADHERRRKEQLDKLWNRTEAQVEEEQRLVQELRKIEARQKERERKAMDLQKLISAAERGHSGLPSSNSNPSLSGTSTPNPQKKKVGKNPVPTRLSESADSSAATSSVLRFPDSKAPGTHIRSQKMKVPQQLGQKKLKAMETAVAALGLEAVPMGTEEVAGEFNGLREDVLLLFELKSALASQEFQLVTKQQHILNASGELVGIPQHLRVSSGPGEGSATPLGSPAPSDASPNPKRRLTDQLQLSTSALPLRRRKAAVQQTNVLRRLRKS